MTTSTPLPCSPAAERNKGPILEALQRLLPRDARVLEVASGTGQHAAHFAAARSDWRWQPTEADVHALPAIAAHVAGLPNVQPPRPLDVCAPWPAELGRFDAVFCANMVHIAPWPACEALMRGAAAHLAAGGRLLLYGPFLVDGETPAPSNLAFDASLRQRDPAWGIRTLAQVCEAATQAGLGFEQRVPMPANNLLLAFVHAA